MEKLKMWARNFFRAEKIRKKIRHFLGDYFEVPVAAFFHKLGMSPTHVSVIGLLIGVGAAVAVAFGWLWLGGVLFLIGASMDMVDGAIARRYNMQSRLGGMLDSLFDRFQEAAMFIGLMVHFAYTIADAPQLLYILLTAVVLFGAYSFSYIRALAGAVGEDIRTGFFSRVERALVIIIFLLASLPEVLVIILVVGIVPNLIWRMANTIRRLSATKEE